MSTGKYLLTWWDVLFTCWVSLSFNPTYTGIVVSFSVSTLLTHALSKLRLLSVDEQFVDFKLMPQHKNAWLGVILQHFDDMFC